jgi:hypothetical protein
MSGLGPLQSTWQITWIGSRAVSAGGARSGYGSLKAGGDLGSSCRGLSDLQSRVLEAFRDVDDTWLTGGAALAAFHSSQRRSNDLDLFTTRGDRLEELSRRLMHWCTANGVSYEVEQEYPGFRRYRVSTDDEQTLVDLVHELSEQVVPVAEKPMEDGIRHDPLRELRANKLAALLGRAETKDLVDLYVLQGLGWEPLGGLEDASRKDGGLDEATLAWVLSDLRIDLEGLMLEEPLSAEEIEAFRDRLVVALQTRSWPKGSS